MRLGERQQALHRRAAELDRPQRVAWTTIATSVATWSLRERPVWSLPASGADLLAEQPLDRHVDVLVGVLEAEAVLGHPRADPLQAGVDLLQLVRVEDADLGRPRAWACDWSMS